MSTTISTDLAPAVREALDKVASLEPAEYERFKQELLRLEDAIRKLKIEFDIFFNGAAKRPPLEARARTEAQMKRIADDRRLTYAQRYRLNAIVSRFTSYRELWRRTLKARGEELI